MKLLIIPILAGSLMAQTPAPAAAPVKKATPAPSWQTLKFPPLREVKIPEVTQFALPNGMRVYLLENHELPVISGFALVRTGNLFDPKDKIGLADLTGTVMRTGGAKGKKGDALNEQLENIAASVESSIGETSGRVGFNCLKENTDEVLGVFKNVLASPDFAQDKIELAKTQEKSAIARRNDDAHAIANREFNNLLYGRNTPYGWQQEYATVDAIKREDAVAFHKRYFFPKNILLAVYGDFSIPEMRGKLEKLFADWTVEQSPVPEFPKVDTTTHPGIYLATKNDVNQTNFSIGHLAGTLRDKDYPALEVMGSVLGGSPFTSRIGTAIRVRGYAYSIGADWGANYNHPGIFRIAGGTKSENTVNAIRTVQEEVKKLLEKEPTDAEVKSAKDKILNTFVFNFDSPSKTLSRLVTYEYYGYPKDFIFDYQKAVEGVTKADVLRVAKQYLKPENFTYVVVGKPADFGTALTALNMPVNNIDLAIPEPKRELTKADAASTAKGRALLAKMAAAMGGEDKIARIKDVTQNVDAEMAMGGMKAKTRHFWLAPSNVRVESELPFGKIVSFYDGRSGWIKTPQGEAPLSGPILRQVQEQVFHDLLGLARSASMPDRTVNYVGDGVIEISNKEGLVTRLHIDEATGLPKKQTYSAAGMAGAPREVEQTYAEIKEFGGLKLPSGSTVVQDGKKFGEFKVTDIQIDSGLKLEEMSKKP